MPTANQTLDEKIIEIKNRKQTDSEEEREFLESSEDESEPNLTNKPENENNVADDEFEKAWNEASRSSKD